METLRDLLSDAVRKESSVREFCRKSEIDPNFVNNVLNGKDVRPELATLIKLSEYLHRDLESLVALAYPDVASKTKLSPAARLLAQRIEALPEDIRTALWKLVTGEV